MSDDRSSPLRGAVEKFLVKWAEVEPHINGIFGLQFARTGVQYSGPTLAAELQALRDALLAESPVSPAENCTCGHHKVYHGILAPHRCFCDVTCRCMAYVQAVPPLTSQPRPEALAELRAFNEDEIRLVRWALGQISGQHGIEGLPARVLAALKASPVPAPAWQPIETADKELRFGDFTGNYGERVLVFTADRRIGTARYWSDGRTIGWAFESGRIVEPTHWMPLPHPPVPAPVRTDEAPQ